MDPSIVKRRLTCILAADAVGYSKQMGHDEDGTIRVLSAHRAVIDGIIIFHQGRIVSTAGDSVLAEFSSAVDAVRCAVEIQEALKTRNDSLPEHRKMHFRVGVNLGDVVVKNDDLLGDGVNVAARLESVAEPGGICISSSVYDQITGRLDLAFQDIGEQTLKNISRPIRVYRVSGAAVPVRLTLPVPTVASVADSRSSLPWAIAAVVALAIGAVAVWQGGWLQSGSPDQAKGATKAAPIAAPQPMLAAEKRASHGAAVQADAVTLAQAETDAKRVRADAQAIKRQAEAELARARADVQAARTARTKSEADSAAAQLRTQPVPTAPTQQDASTRESTSAPVAVIATDKSLHTTAGNASRFDGGWKVTVNCPKHEDGALGYTVDFVAEAKDGVLRGESGTEGSPGWLLLRGRIDTDGNAMFDAKGLTADPRLNVKAVGRGTPYAYQVAAHFDGVRGTGRRLQLRACVLTFAKL